MLLSILIPTIESRKQKFKNLEWKLRMQVLAWFVQHKTKSVEIISDDSPTFLEGGKSIGQKRNDLLQRATGQYACFFDDDDTPAPNYLQTLLALCNEGNDVVTFNTLVKTDYYWTVINMSLANAANEETAPGRIIERTPWHICPVKTEIAKQIPFAHINHNEDWTWMQQVIPHLKTESHTNAILTQYTHSDAGSEADKIVKHERPHHIAGG